MAIGDLHGRDVWKSFGDISLLMSSEGSFQPDYDKYIFVGDYCDSFDLNHSMILYNLKEVIRFKKMYPDNVILLLGNHDVQYMCTKPFTKYNPYSCSGYSWNAHVDFYTCFNDNREIFQLTYQKQNYLFSHSFISTDWYRESFRSLYFEFMEDIGMNENVISLSLGEAINIAFEYRLDCIFDVGHIRSGAKKYGGPLWEDISRVDNALTLYHQIVGHSPTGRIRTHILLNNTSVTFIDVLKKRESFYTVNISDNEETLQCKC